MAIPARQRWVVYAIALVLTLAAVKWAGGQDPAEARAVVANQAERPERPAREASAAAAPPDAPLAVRLDQLERRASGASAGDPFQPRSWEPPRPAVVVKRTPPPPQAPALPFTYLGRMIDGDQTVVFLAALDRNYIVRLGDTLDGRYRVEGIEENALVLTYLPLGARQILALSAAPAAPGRAAARKPAPDDDEDDDS